MILVFDDAFLEQPSVMLYAEHIGGYGVEFFQLACEQDLEGIVAKAKHAAYGEKWFRIRNPRYSQYEGRRELFERSNSLSYWAK